MSWGRCDGLLVADLQLGHSDTVETGRKGNARGKMGREKREGGETLCAGSCQRWVANEMVEVLCCGAAMVVDNG